MTFKKLLKNETITLYIHIFITITITTRPSSRDTSVSKNTFYFSVFRHRPEMMTTGLRILTITRTASKKKS